MSNFLADFNTAEECRVAKYKLGKLLVSTILASDTSAYETAVSHPHYDGGNWVIVAEYEDRGSAQIGHNEWVVKMTADELPKSLRDVSSADMAQMCDLSGTEWRTRVLED